jgi:hypothetical protein
MILFKKAYVLFREIHTNTYFLLVTKFYNWDLVLGLKGS